MLAINYTNTRFFPKLLGATVFTVYIGLGNSIDLATTFEIIVFFNLIMNPMVELPAFIASYVDFRVSMARVQDFLSSK